MNILLIHSDQHRYDCIAAHGAREVHTPNLDRLVREGVTFSRAYTTIPICTAARASLLTGAWPTRHGSFCIPTSEIDRAARPQLPTVFQLVKQAGYRTGWVGKYHRELECESPGPAEGVDTFIPNWHYQKQVEAGRFPPLPKPRSPFGLVNTAQAVDQTSLAWQADQVIGLLGGDREGRPSFIRWDPPEPHLPCHPASAFADLYRAGDIPPWPSFPDSLEGKPGVLRRQQALWGVEGWDWARWQPIVRLYYGIISELDHHIGRVLRHLDETGLAENTVVLYSTDHGDFCGGHGLLDKHFCFYEDIARVPLLARWPGRLPPGTVCPAYVSGAIDLARTLLAVAGVEAPASFDGHDLTALALDPGFRPRDAAYAQYFGTESGLYSCRMIRRDRFKFVYHPVGDTDELYDLESDPGELCNLVHHSGYQEVLTSLKSRLWSIMREQGDRLGNGWTAVELAGAPSFAAKFGLNRETPPESTPPPPPRAPN